MDSGCRKRGQLGRVKAATPKLVVLGNPIQASSTAIVVLVPELER